MRGVIRSVVAAFISLLAPVLASALAAQDRASRPDFLIGEATAVDAVARRLNLKTDSGESVVVAISADAVLLRARPGATNLADAIPLQLTQIVAGDRVLVRGARVADQSVQARQVVVMARDDVARKQEAERDDWRKRGVLGVVTALDAARRGITMRLGRAAEAPTLTLSTAAPPARFRRYAPDSVKFSDAQPSTFEEVRVGDELRALGDRDPGSGVFVAEQVVFGAFRVVSGSISALDAARNTLVVRDDESQQDVSVAVGPDARMRRLPPEIAGRLARRGDGGNGAGTDRGGVREGGPGSRPEDLLERLPPATLAELKPGDRVLVSSTRGRDASRANAIAVLVGVEALLAAPGRSGRGLDAGLPPELLDLGLSIP